MSELPLLLNAKRAAEFIGVGRTQFFALVSEGKVQSVVVKRSKMYRRADLEKFIANLKPRRG